MQKIYIKGMVCSRCIDTVRAELERIGIQLEDIALGEVTLAAATNNFDQQGIQTQLENVGFSLLEDKKYKLVADVKVIVAEIYSGDFDFPVRFRFSSYISAYLHKNYDLVSASFSAIAQETLEHYIINYRIQKTKEFLAYPGQTLADIAFRLGFSSVAHLSRQFKAVAGTTPSLYRSIGENINSAGDPENKILYIIPPIV